MRNRKLTNKGAALVTVLVVTTFLSVLVTSLLYMSYMNYITKSLRYRSTDNFYTDEFALDDLATELQQKAVDDGHGAQSVIDAVKADSAGSKWDPTKMKSYIQIASKEAAIQVVANGSPDIVKDGNTVTFKNIKLISTTSDNYKSSIVSDLSIAWPSVPKQSFGINDFSIITDAQIDVKGGNLAIGGCLYCRQQSTQTWAIKVESGAILNINSPMAIVHGNILVENGGMLVIGGKVWITGTINFQTGGMAFITGDVKYAGATPTSSYIKGKQPEKVYSDPDQVAEWLDKINDVAGTQGVTNSMVNTDIDLWCPGAVAGSSYFKASDVSAGYIFDPGQFCAASKALKDGSKVYSVMGMPVDVINGVNNSLILCKQNMIIRGDMSNSTFICASKQTVTVDIDSQPTFMQRMTEEAYEAAKDTLWGGASTDPNPGNFGAAATVQNYNGFTPKFRGGHFSDIPSSELIKFSESNFGLDEEDELKYYRDAAGNNIIPFSNLITPTAEGTIASLLSAVQGGEEDPSKSFVVYSNWNKE